MSGNGAFGALADGFMQGAALRDSRKQRKLDEEMARMAAQDRARQLELQQEMQRAQMEAHLRDLALKDQTVKNNQEETAWRRMDADRKFAAGQADTEWGRNQAAAKEAARRAQLEETMDAQFAGMPAQAQQMQLAGNRPVGVGIFQPGRGPADVQKWQARYPLVQARLAQEQESLAGQQQLAATRAQADLLRAQAAGRDKPVMGWEETIQNDEKGYPIGKTRMPLAPGQPRPLSTEDQAALTWAQANPSDPRAAAIRQRLGR